MDIKQEFINYYKYVETLTQDKELINLERICKFLRIKQQSIAVVFYLFYIIKSKLQIEPEDIVVQCASIMLACKMESIHRPTDKIMKYAFLLNNIELENDLKEYYLDCIMKTEIEISIALDFNLEPPCFYKVMENTYEKIKTHMSSIKLGLIILNDIITKPVCVVFEIEEIVLSCFFIAYLSELEKTNDEEIASKCVEERIEIKSDEEIASKFLEKINMNNINVDAIVFIASEIYKMYKIN